MNNFREQAQSGAEDTLAADFTGTLRTMKKRYEFLSSLLYAGKLCRGEEICTICTTQFPTRRSVSHATGNMVDPAEFASAGNGSQFFASIHYFRSRNNRCCTIYRLLVGLKGRRGGTLSVYCMTVHRAFYVCLMAPMQSGCDTATQWQWHSAKRHALATTSTRSHSVSVVAWVQTCAQYSGLGARLLYASIVVTINQYAHCLLHFLFLVNDNFFGNVFKPRMLSMLCSCIVLAL